MTCNLRDGIYEYFPWLQLGGVSCSRAGAGTALVGLAVPFFGPLYGLFVVVGFMVSFVAYFALMSSKDSGPCHGGSILRRPT